MNHFLHPSRAGLAAEPIIPYRLGDGEYEPTGPHAGTSSLLGKVRAVVVSFFLRPAYMQTDPLGYLDQTRGFIQVFGKRGKLTPRLTFTVIPVGTKNRPIPPCSSSAGVDHGIDLVLGIWNKRKKKQTVGTKS